jgi:hypothetical protein
LSLLLATILYISRNESNGEPDLTQKNKTTYVSRFILIVSFLGLLWIPISAYMVNQPPLLLSFSANPNGLQIYGQPVTFVANAEDANNDQIFYRFLVDEEVTRLWSKSNSWKWYTSLANPEKNYGKYNITVEVKDGTYDDRVDDYRYINYTLASAKITYPKNNDFVRPTQTVSGISRGIGIDQKDLFWIFVKDTRSGYHPQDRLDLFIEPNGNWTSEIYTSGASGTKCEIVAVLLNETALESIAAYYDKNKKAEFNNSKTNDESKKELVWTGFNKLPVGAKEVDSIKVTRE